ncbi:hypothetical protein IPG41_00675 [Candidatus Peregrinibacteria bacterium]|nr:MAG: hypothetical protein IPG41_00675 [Candidatus Peregrinibacteria bacterium]
MVKNHKRTSTDSFFETHVLESVMENLIQKGYPPETLSTCWNQDGYIFDLAVVDNTTNELIAVIETQIQNPIIATSTNLRDSLKKYSEIARLSKVILFIVSLSNSTLKFSQFVPDKEDNEKGTFVPIDSLPSFEVLREKILGIKRKETRDQIRNICSLLFVLTLLVLLADFFNYIEVSFERLTLLGALAVFALVPHANKLKILNIEFERKKSE